MPTEEQRLDGIVSGLRGSPSYCRFLLRLVAVANERPDEEAEIASMTDHEVFAVMKALDMPGGVVRT